MSASANSAERAARALSLFEVLRASMDNTPAVLPTTPSSAKPNSQAKLRATPGAVAPAVSTCNSAAAASISGTAAAVQKPSPPREDAEKALLRRKLAHAETLVEKLHGKNASLRARLRELEKAAEANAVTAEKDAARTAESATVQDLRQQVAALKEKLAEQAKQHHQHQQRQATATEAATARNNSTSVAASVFDSTDATTAAAGGHLQRRAAVLEVELLTTRQRLRACEAHCQQLAGIHLGPLLSCDAGSPTGYRDSNGDHANDAREMVNAEVRRLFAVLRAQLAEEACLREAERARWSELLYLVDKDAAANC